MRVLFPVTILLFPLLAQADVTVYRCETPEGKVIYQEEPCAKGHKGEKREIMTNAAEARAVPEEGKAEKPRAEAQKAEGLKAAKLKSQKLKSRCVKPGDRPRGASEAGEAPGEPDKACG